MHKLGVRHHSECGSKLQLYYSPIHSYRVRNVNLTCGTRVKCQTEVLASYVTAVSVHVTIQSLLFFYVMPIGEYDGR
jgi:hypothetical protein